MGNPRPQRALGAAVQAAGRGWTRHLDAVCWWGVSSATCLSSTAAARSSHCQQRTCMSATQAYMANRDMVESRVHAWVKLFLCLISFSVERIPEALMTDLCRCTCSKLLDSLSSAYQVSQGANVTLMLLWVGTHARRPPWCCAASTLNTSSMTVRRSQGSTSRNKVHARGTGLLSKGKRKRLTAPWPSPPENLHRPIFSWILILVKSATTLPGFTLARQVPGTPHVHTPSSGRHQVVQYRLVHAYNMRPLPAVLVQWTPMAARRGLDAPPHSVFCHVMCIVPWTLAPLVTTCPLKVFAGAKHYSWKLPTLKNSAYVLRM